MLFGAAHFSSSVHKMTDRPKAHRFSLSMACSIDTNTERQLLEAECSTCPQFPAGLVLCYTMTLRAAGHLLIDPKTSLRSSQRLTLLIDSNQNARRTGNSGHLANGKWPGGIWQCSLRNTMLGVAQYGISGDRRCYNEVSTKRQTHREVRTQSHGSLIGRGSRVAERKQRCDGADIPIRVKQA